MLRGLGQRFFLLATALLLAATVPVALVGQQTCADCNNLTDECQTTPVNGGLDDTCDEGGEGEDAWCNSHGGLDNCLTMVQTGADGSISSEVLQGVIDFRFERVAMLLNHTSTHFLRDCRDRIMQRFYTTEKADEMRSQSAVIEI